MSSLIKNTYMCELPNLSLFSSELNTLEPVKRTSSQCSNSNSSLPSAPSVRASGVGQVASWAVSFERLLEDPLGVLYFTVSLRPMTGVFAKQMLLKKKNPIQIFCCCDVTGNAYVSLWHELELILLTLILTYG